MYWWSVTLLTALLIGTTSCKKKDKESSPGPSAPAVNSRQVKYEVTGTFSGHLDMTYTNAGGTLTTVEVSSLPWSVELTAESTVYAVAIGGGSDLSDNLGQPGQSVTMKIYSAGKQVKTQTTNTNEYGSIYIPAISYGF